jgi:gamma-glutamylcyclotransferase (GGCT)/AIG2-like uncharacterized protein YtfP
MDGATLEAADGDFSDDTRFVFVYGSLLSGDAHLFHNHDAYLGPGRTTANDAADQANHHHQAPTKVCDATTALKDFALVAQTCAGDHSEPAAFDGGSSPLVLDPAYPLAVDLQELEAACAAALAPGRRHLTACGVVGEVWRVSAATLAHLDVLEGHPTYYRRRLVHVIPTVGDTGGEAAAPLTAHMYLLASPRHLASLGESLRCPRTQRGPAEVTPLGDWRQHRRASAAESLRRRSSASSGHDQGDGSSAAGP